SYLFLFIIRRPPLPTLFPYTTLFRSTPFEHSIYHLFYFFTAMKTLFFFLFPSSDLHPNFYFPLPSFFAHTIFYLRDLCPHTHAKSRLYCTFIPIIYF